MTKTPIVLAAGFVLLALTGCGVAEESDTEAPVKQAVIPTAPPAPAIPEREHSPIAAEWQN